LCFNKDHFVKNMLNDWEAQDNKILSEQTLPENIIEILDIPYIADGHRGHLLDIYLIWKGRFQL
jgi:hypothetical protein